MNTAAKGRRGEHRTRKVLEAAGYSVTRAAASKGPADLVAWDALSFRFVSVKTGDARAGAHERAALAAMVRPPNSTIEIWRWPDGARHPVVERL